ncbi:MAG: valine--tRNA ligase [Candidatus Muiribacterium halophilum]|uniref:Valine--tRNA ligase n=1 Tax=Muiribacterium halophilum TaxID=2053465 RepID=A0A2N5ZM92_MUIH1|nr:MAG: valine--tRNA ligase [Candidatus Muirbacterium halophilum]
MDTKYNPSGYEQKLLEKWLSNNTFHSEPDKKKDPFTIVIPPPNVTGVLHMGHALNNTYQDILIRYRRMSGLNACWVPGTDHAGIATQNVVEKKLAKEGKSRYDVGREAFIEDVWEWKKHHGDYIIDQLKKIGCACDWERERFTMDEGLSKAVFTAFQHYYEKGLLYRGHRIINWCPRCQTALSDIETEHQELPGKLYHVKYPIKDSDEFITVATTRPETMLGDVAVAFHPDDERYHHLKGKKIILPIVNKEIEVVYDEYVDREFGTGAVKITPAHDPNDFEVGKRHDLEPVLAMNEDGTMNENAGELEGLDRFVARKKVIEILKEQGLLVKVEENPHNVGHCYRCDTIVEPYLSKQWFVNMKPLAEKAIEVVEQGRIKFTPERWKKVFLEWLYNIRDWCVSRQIWWGHRIPVYYCQDCDEIMVSANSPEKCTKCGSTNIKQDEDVLDTWFSSALWPFSTLGWPEKTKDLEYYYPTSQLVTAPEILFFWVARMIMSGMEFMGDIPFSEVFLTGTVRDETGRKMSKSLGNVIDPLKIIKEYGADALRFTLMVITAQGQDVFLSDEKFQIGRNFYNKLWNASRFVISNLEEYNTEFNKDNLDILDSFILTRLEKTKETISAAYKDFRFDVLSKSIYEFIWDDFCDWYIEGIKPYIYGKKEDDGNKMKVACYVLDNALRMLHPVMPFITEEIHNHLTKVEKSLIDEKYPIKDDQLIDEENLTEFKKIQGIVKEIRNLKAQSNIKKSETIKVILLNDSFKDEESLHYVQYFAGAELELVDTLPEGGKYSKAVAENVEILVDLTENVDLEEEKERLKGEIDKLVKEIERSTKMLNNKGFVANAPEKVVEKEKEKFEMYKESKSKLEETYKNLFPGEEL